MDLYRFFRPKKRYFMKPTVAKSKIFFDLLWQFDWFVEIALVENANNN